MQIKDQILFVLKEARKPITAKEIARRFILHFNERISKREVNKIIHNELKSVISSSGFPSYKYSFIKEKKNITSSETSIIKYPKQEKINFDQAYTKLEKSSDKNISVNIYKLIDEYIIYFHKFRTTKDNSIRDKCLLMLDQIIEYIISNKLSFNEISDYLEKEALIHKQILGHKKLINHYKKFFLKVSIDENISNTSTLNNDLFNLIYKYENIYSNYIELNRKPINVKNSIHDIIKELDQELIKHVDLIVQNILFNNISLSNLQNHCSDNLYIKIENHEDIFKWISSKEEDNSIHFDSYNDRLKDFKILCQQVWEDGVVDDHEQILIDKKIYDLKIDIKDAKNIFDKFRKNWSFISDDSIEQKIKINYINKQIVFKNNNLSKEELLTGFINNLFKTRLKHRSPELDLFFENFEEFYE